jgi:histidine triad (HIT) family protein
MPRAQATAADRSCVFCEIAAGRVAAARVLDDGASIAFLDHRPLFPGHVLLVPRAHVPTLLDLAPAELGPLFANAQRIAAALERGLGAQGSFVAVNNRVSQSVPHLHVHVVPRSRGDGLRGFFWPRHAYADPAEQQRVADAIRRELERAGPPGSSQLE